MIAPNMTPMFIEEIFKVNLYCNDAQIDEFNKLIEDAEKNCMKIKDFIDAVFIVKKAHII